MEVDLKLLEGKRVGCVNHEGGGVWTTVVKAYALGEVSTPKGAVVEVLLLCKNDVRFGSAYTIVKDLYDNIAEDDYWVPEFMNFMMYDDAGDAYNDSPLTVKRTALMQLLSDIEQLEDVRVGGEA